MSERWRDEQIAIDRKLEVVMCTSSEITIGDLSLSFRPLIKRMKIAQTKDCQVANGDGLAFPIPIPRPYTSRIPNVILYQINLIINCIRNASKSSKSYHNSTW
jgi:hypothetical protein